jgi:predicted transcriptional regulator
MPLIQKEKKDVLKTIPIKFEEGLADRVQAYANFLESSRDYVVSEAVRYIMDRDREFAAHMSVAGPASQKLKQTRTGQPPTGSSAKAGQ